MGFDRAIIGSKFVVLRNWVIITFATTPLKTESGMFIKRNVTIMARALTLLKGITS